MLSPAEGAIYGMAAGSAFVAVVYMLSKLANSQGLGAYSKLEAGELIFSAIIAALVIAALAGQWEIVKSLTGGNNSTLGSEQDVSALMKTYMEEPLESLIDAMAKNVFRFTKIASYNYNMQAPNILPISPTGSASPGAGANPLISQMLTSIDTSSQTLALSKSMRIGYMFLNFAFISMLMPVGLFLRMLAPTRKAGALLIGTGLAVQIVYPVSVGWSVELGREMAPSLDSANDGKGAENGGLSLPDPGRGTGEFMANDAINAAYAYGETIGPTYSCTIACAIGCAIAQLIAPGSYALCVEGCVGEPGNPPTAPGFACSGILGYVMFMVDIAYPIIVTVDLVTNDLNMGTDEIIEEYYKPLVNEVMPVVVERNLVILVMAIIQLAATIVLARAFSQAIGSEGQLYGIGRLI